MKPCPHCGEEIQDRAVKCRWCRTMLDVDDLEGRRSYEPAAPSLALSAEDAPPRDTTEAWSLSRIAKRPLFLGAAAVTIVIALAVLGGSEPREGSTVVPEDPLAATAAALGPDLSAFNTGAEAEYFRTIIKNQDSLYGPGRCWAGFRVDFPDQSLITIIWPSGWWFQIWPGAQNRTALASSMRLGQDYVQAGISSSQMDATGVPCATLPGGGVQLLR